MVVVAREGVGQASEAREGGVREGLVVQALSGWFVVATASGRLLCRPRGRLKRRAEVWRDVRDAERAEAVLDAEDVHAEGLDPDCALAPDDQAVDERRVVRPAARLPDAGRPRHASDRDVFVQGEGGTAQGRPVVVTADAVGCEGVLAGDQVLCRDVGDGEGTIETVLPRRGLLARPPVANADHVVVVVCWRAPEFSAGFVDRLLVLAAAQGYGVTLCMNKADMLAPDQRADVVATLAPYVRAGVQTLLVSAVSGEGVDALATGLAAHLSVVAGPSGAGKSRLISRLCPERTLRSGELSRHAGRGRHTTRHVELLMLPRGGWVADTPGFSRLSLDGMAPDALSLFYPEFATLGALCRFRGCLHDQEPECAVRDAVAKGDVDPGRYQRYLELVAECRTAVARRY